MKTAKIACERRACLAQGIESGLTLAALGFGICALTKKFGPLKTTAGLWLVTEPIRQSNMRKHGGRSTSGDALALFGAVSLACSVFTR